MGYPGAMPPEKKSKTGLYVGLGCGCLVLLALLIGVIALAVMLMGGDDPKDSGDGGTTTSAAAPAPGQNNGDGDNPAPDPAPNGGGDNPAPNPAPAPNGGGDNPAPAPDGGNSNLPQQVGEYTLGEVATDNVVGADYEAIYTSSTGQINVSGAENPITTIEDREKHADPGRERPGDQRLDVRPLLWGCVGQRERLRQIHQWHERHQGHR